MAQLGDLQANVQVHLTWDTEPTEKAKDFVRMEVYKALQETFQESSWLREMVQAEVQRELGRIGKAYGRHIG